MSEPHYIVIDIDDPQKDGIYRDWDAVTKGAIPFFVEKEGTPFKFRPARRSDALDGPPWVDVNTQSAEIHATVGNPGQVLAGIGTADFATDAAGVITVVNRQTGTATKRSIQRIHIDNHVVPTDGNIVINFNRPELVTIACVTNKGVAQKFQAEFTTADVAGDHHLTYDDWTDANGTVRVWLNNGSGGAPAAPAVGRLLPVVYVNGDTAATLAGKVKAVLIADAVFTCVYAAASVVKLIVEDTGRGPRTLPVGGSVVSTGVIYTAITAGASGQLSGKTFKLFDTDGSVGVWFKVGTALAPIVAAECNRNISVTVTDNDTAATVATAVQTAIDADAQFTASVVSGTTSVLVTDVTGGARENAVAIDAPVGITISQTGKGLTFNGPFDAPENKIEKGLEGYFEVVRRHNNDIDFRSVDVGPQPALLIDASDVEFPNVILGKLLLNTPEMAAYFAAALLLDANLQYVALTLELKIGFVGYDLVTVCRVLVRVYRTIFDAGVLPISGIGASGKTAIGNGNDFVTVVFTTPLANANWHFAGNPSISDLVDGGATLNLLATTLTARSAAGFTIQLTAATNTANYKLEWIVVMD